MLKIGLTGGIGSGKTTATNYFKVLGVPIVDADEIARDLVRPGLAAYELIIRAFGKQVIDEEAHLDRAHLDRAKLRQLIFSDAVAKQKLEAILHPLIRKEIARRVNALKTDYCVIAIPLLIETEQFSLVDRILVIDVDPELQLDRTQTRDGDSRAQVEAMINSQVGREARLKLADDVLDNCGDIDQMRLDIDKLHLKYLDLSISSI